MASKKVNFPSSTKNEFIDRLMSMSPVEMNEFLKDKGECKSERLPLSVPVISVVIEETNE